MKNKKITHKLKKKKKNKLKVSFKLIRNWEFEAYVDESIIIDKKFILYLIVSAFVFDIVYMI